MNLSKYSIDKEHGSKWVTIHYYDLLPVKLDGPQILLIVLAYIEWCEGNLKLGEWGFWTGVNASFGNLQYTYASYLSNNGEITGFDQYISFKNEQDAVAFKLRFGL